jgi:hypothetical protein
MADETFAEKVGGHIQYGTPEESVNAVASVVDARLQQLREAQELQRCKKLVGEFGRNNRDISDDPEASAAAEQEMYKIYESELARCGYTRDQLRQAHGREPVGSDWADLHLKMRANHPGSVSAIEDAMEQAVANYRNARDDNSGHRTAVVRAVQQRVDATRKLKGEVGLGGDYAGTERPARDPEIARRQSAFEQMKAARQTARAASFRDFHNGKVNRGSAA